MSFQPFHFAAENPFKLREELDLYLNVPPLEGAGAVFKFFRARLGFPPVQNPDWDWFEDCVSDLEWVPAHRIILDHSALPEFDGPDDLAAYLGALWEAAGYMHDFDHHELLVIFPPDSQSAVEAGLEVEKAKRA